MTVAFFLLPSVMYECIRSAFTGEVPNSINELLASTEESLTIFD